MYTIESLIKSFKINDTVIITFINLYGTVKGYGSDISLNVDRIPYGLAWIPVNNPKV